MNIGDPIKTTVEEIRKVLNIENVIGETIETDEFLLIPVTRMGMGFGAGMGLPNIKRNADEFNISSVPGKGTTVDIVFYLSNTKNQ